MKKKHSIISISTICENLIDENEEIQSRGTYGSLSLTPCSSLSAMSCGKHDVHSYLMKNQNIQNNDLAESLMINKNGCVKRKVDISRDVIDWNDLNLNYGKLHVSKKSLNQKISESAKKYYSNWSPLGFIIRLFPIISWIRTYSIRNYLLNDLISGFTILILHIPQGMAYGILAGLGAINGLYVSFFPVIIYALMGTSRHISIGTFAIVSIMASKAATDLSAVPYGFSADTSIRINGTDEETTNVTVLEVLTSICIATGIIQMVMGFLQLGALAVILSDTLVSAFSTGCAVHVATSQLHSLFDIMLPKHIEQSTPFELINTWIAIIVRLGETNLVTLGISIASILILALVKEFVEPVLKKKFPLPMPIPIDLLLIIGVTVISWLMKLHVLYDVQIIGTIPTGLPSPKLPRFDIIFSVLKTSIMICIVAYGISLSLAKIYAKKDKYKIDANQELIALGSANVFSSFFACYPSAASLSRSSVQHRTGGKTQMAGLISCAFLLIVLLFLGPLLYHLPKCILASTILVALKSMFLQINDFFKSWKISKLEASQWMVTFVCVVLLGVDIGLIIGIVYSVFVVLLRFALPRSTINGRLPLSEIYVNCELYKEAKEISGIKIYQFSCALFFINAQSFKTSLLRKSLNISIDEVESLMENKPLVHTIIIDCSSIFYIDSTGIEVMIEVIEQLKEMHVNVILASCQYFFMKMLDKTDFLKQYNWIPICATVHDAVVQCDTSDS